MNNKNIDVKSNKPLAVVYCIGTPITFLIILMIPETRGLFKELTEAHPFISGFIKFALLSTAGEMLAGAMTRRRFIFPYAITARAVVWGFLGVVITLVFKLFGIGVEGLLEIGYLPGGQHFFMKALWTSVCMNVFFAPVMMGAHRFFDSWLDLKEEQGAATLKDATKAMDWTRYITFVLAKTVPFFWIPAHTITFLLPESYRVMMAAFLSITLGAIMVFAANPDIVPHKSPNN